MCRLFGVLGPGIISKDIKIVRELGIASMVNGLDGSGVFQTRSNGTGNLESGYKSWYNWVDFLDEIETDRKHASLLYNVNVDVIMCHVRAATQGKITDSNAHPYAFTSLVGAHNGVLRDLKYSRGEQTDSCQMFADMDKRGVLPVLEELDRESAFALTIWDRKNKKMIFVRNEKRPLAVAFLKERGVMFYASEMLALKYILGRNGCEATYFNIRPDLMATINPQSITAQASKDDPLSIFSDMVKVEYKKPDYYAGTYVSNWKGNNHKNSSSKQAKVDRDIERAVGKELALVAETNKQSVEEKKEVTASAPVTRSVPEVKGEVIPFTVRDNRWKVGSLYSKCTCGTRDLTPLDMNLARRGKKSDLKYNADSGKFECLKCPEVKSDVSTQVQTSVVERPVG